MPRVRPAATQAAEIKVKRFHLEDPAATVRELFAKLQPNKTITIGIDPGQAGGIAFVPDDRSIPPVIVDMPVYTVRSMSKVKGERKETNRGFYDHQQILRLFDPAIEHVAYVTIAIERGQPRPFDTAKTGFSVGVSYGMWGLFFAAFGFRTEEIAPASWKPKLGLPKGADKTASRHLATRLFPAAAHFMTAKSDDGRAEALLVAEAIKRRSAS